MKIRLANQPVTRPQLDNLCRQLTKLKANNCCEHCGRTKPEVVLQWSHVLSTGAHGNLRWEPLNHILLCYRCHIHWWHKNPHEAVRWFDEKWPGRYDRLLFLAQTIHKPDKSAIKLYLQQEIKKAEVDTGPDF